jgi:predicted nucleic acid-binding protein
VIQPRTFVREIVKAFEELVPVSVLRDRALAIAVELRHPAYDCFYLALAGGEKHLTARYGR